MSHHMVPGTTFKHTNQSLPTAPKKIQIVKANATTVLARSLNTHSTNSKPCLSWILDEPLGQQLQPLIRFNTPISPKFVIRTALPLPTIPPIFLSSKVATREMESLYRSLVGPTIVTKEAKTRENTRFDIARPMIATDSNNFEQIWTPSIDSTEV